MSKADELGIYTLYGQYVLKNNNEKVMSPHQVRKFLFNTNVLYNVSLSQFLIISTYDHVHF